MLLTDTESMGLFLLRDQEVGGPVWLRSTPNQFNLNGSISKFGSLQAPRNQSHHLLPTDELAIQGLSNPWGN
jgi:hypothetical protein